jgi:abelson tyrosine-protein kinase 1
LADVHAERRPSAHSVDSSEHSVVPVQEVIPPIETSEDEFTSAESPSTEDTSSVNTPSSNDDFWYDAEIDVDHDPHYESPIRTGTGFMDRMNERRYRLHLMHEFHPSLNLPLWTPVRVELGAVGYLQKPDGIFCTLFNASDPAGTSAKGMAKSLPSLKGYGDISRGSKTENKRSVAQRGLDWVSGMMIFKSRGSATFS